MEVNNVDKNVMHIYPDLLFGNFRVSFVTIC